jgi:urease accessory protein
MTTTASRGATTTSAGIVAAAIMAETLLPLFAWLSPAYPVGAYAYSHGLEWVVEAGEIKDRATAAQWIGDILRHGGGRNDAILFSLSYRAARGEDGQFAAVAELAAAMAPSRERRLETMQQGRAFAEATLAAWPSDRYAALIAAVAGEAAYPVAVGAAAAAHELPLQVSLEAYLLAFAANLVSAVVRSVPLGQTDGQKIVAELAAVVCELAQEALDATVEDLGGATLRLDIASMRHETQYTRLFRS